MSSSSLTPPCESPRRSGFRYPANSSWSALPFCTTPTHPPDHRDRHPRGRRNGPGARAVAAREKGAATHRTHAEGARNAVQLLRELAHPDRAGEPVVDGKVRDRCAAIIARHDDWKLGKPHPPAADREALVCFEADALWPLHPLGVLADLERPGESGVPKDGNDPAEWRGQILNNLADAAGVPRKLGGDERPVPGCRYDLQDRRGLPDISRMGRVVGLLASPLYRPVCRLL